ncbi:lytic transglycosylase domain-containing protein [Roseateles saccharophilus]|uniref:Transglycosylase-like protein with SLT domain n=1 Tax=Roseateles saccharophilus TaxID=304 RepID=A0A4V2VQ51_ROSSA|nr:lytic transglycosylase domain-containing protein [Roseateles saccharophilus]MDG0833662.1 lytic transglycosylase domain-containing protein [Roseateles saccharophilus]TCU93249.1 transglycosylase-like protein with SLT domain [Roseateles saccharophilus]
MTTRQDLISLARHTRDAASLFVTDIGNGLLVVSHNTLALVGLAVVSVLLVFTSQAGLRESLESAALGWLNARQEARAEAEGNTLLASAEPDAIARATATDPRELSRQQAAVAHWLARRYHVAPEPISRLVQEAWAVGNRAKVEPTLILSIMAIESGFNPFAQSAVGAQGLMQVMTRVHDDKYEAFGGTLAAFDPVTNLRVGVQVLKECIQRGGSLEEGLRYYVGAANLPEDTGYASRVLAEHDLLKAVAAGRTVPASASARPLREAASAPAGESAQVALLR